ncbi:MAG TPA: hydroxymethylbilane synthase, partial [Burkholderiales bacterium]|nr:hydroxymethylbilane synthase [Burkholderiales bacterium]
LKAMLAPLNHEETARCVRAERAMSRALAGSCQVPLGGFAEVLPGGLLRLRGFVATPDGARMARSDAEGAGAAPEELGTALADKLKALGAEQILAQLEAAPR